MAGFTDPMAANSLNGYAPGQSQLVKAGQAASAITTATDPSNPENLLQCVSNLVTGVVQAMYAPGGYGDSAFVAYLGTLLTNPKNQFQSLKDALFTLPGGASAAVDSAEYWSDKSLQSMETAFENPLTSLWQGQFNVLAASANQFIQGVFTLNAPTVNGTPSIAQQLNTNALAVYNQLFVQADTLDANIGGLLKFAITEAIPSLEAELDTIRSMRGAMKGLMAQTCKLPPSMVPGVPNAICTEQLCLAIRDLNSVSATLIAQNAFDTAHFSSATSHTCLAADSILDPSKGITGNLQAQFQNLFGLNDKQFGALMGFLTGKLGALMPNPQFQIQVTLVQRYNSIIQASDAPLVEFNKNLMTLNFALAALGSVQLGQIFAQIVDLLTKQLMMIKTQLDADAAGMSVQTSLQSVDALRTFGAAAPASAPTSAAASPNPNLPAANSQLLAQNQANQGAAAAQASFKAAANPTTASPSNPSYNTDGTLRTDPPVQIAPTSVTANPQVKSTDLMSYVSTQANAYVIISALCFIMKQMQALYTKLNEVLNGQDRILAVIKKFLESYSIQRCGDPSGATNIDNNVKQFMSVASDRLSGKVTSNQPVMQAYRAVQSSLDLQEKYLMCMEGQLNGLLGPLGLDAAVVAATANIVALARSLPALGAQMSNLSIMGIGNTPKTGTNPLDTLLAALQCLVLQCNSPQITSVAKQATNQFNSQKSQGKAQDVNMGTMDQGPKIAQQMATNNRVSSLFQVIQSIQALSSVDISKLCTVQVKQTFTVSTATTASSSGAADLIKNPPLPGNTGIVNQAAALAQQQQTAAQAAGAAIPLSASAPPVTSSTPSMA